MGLVICGKNRYNQGRKEVWPVTSDLHMHMLMDGLNYRQAVQRHSVAPAETWIRERLQDYANRGIRLLRDGGDHLGVALRARELAPEYGIDYRCPAFPIHKQGHYGAIVGRSYTDHRSYLELLDAAEARKADFIKLMISGLIDFSRPNSLTEPALEPEEIRFLIEAAHDRGFSVMVHANGDAAVLPAVQAGVESVEHGAFLSEECLCALAEGRTLWVPTLSTIGNLLGDGRFPDEVLRPLLDTQLEKVAFAAQRRARIGAGSDAGAYRVYHGPAAEQEQSYLRRALGESTADILAEAERYVKIRFQRNRQKERER
ncbi:MAG: amidohydrolase family protein [Oscillospiraceae bacterium]|nr:amidohydrolase family protein [Oscillospiraceae bacterium]